MLPHGINIGRLHDPDADWTVQFEALGSSLNKSADYGPAMSVAKPCLSGPPNRLATACCRPPGTAFPDPETEGQNRPERDQDLS